jgi:phage terminase large subunit GpA-like protein
LSVQAEIGQSWLDILAPSTPPPLSAWAEQNFYLSPDYSATSGLFVPYAWQREVLDSFTDPKVNVIVLMTSTQMIKTILQQIALAYVICEKPGPVLFTEPKEDDATTLSRERIAPMIRDNAMVRDRVAPSKSRDSANTISSKTFRGGSVSFVGANAPGNFARRTIQYLFCDEIDKYAATVEGDQIGLGIQRTMQYGSRAKVVLACSPTVESGKINYYFQRTDQRRPYVACPYCRCSQTLEWSNVRWVNSDPTTAHYQCAHCSHPWSEADRARALGTITWVASNPLAAPNWRGYTISHLYSNRKTIGGVDPKTSLTAAFLEAKETPEQLQVFVNTSLAEIWRQPGDKPKWQEVMARAEDYSHGDEIDGVVPRQVVFITAGVDVQKNWVQAELVGWGAGRECWSLGIYRFEFFDDGVPVSTTSQKYWDEIDRLLMRTLRREDDVALPVMAMAIDTGHNSDVVYNFARGRQRLAVGPAGGKVVAPHTVVCVKGDRTMNQFAKAIVSISSDAASSKRGGLKIAHVGGGFLKTQFYNQLTAQEPGRGYAHFPMYDDDTFRSFCSEERVEKNGQVSFVKTHLRNEALDCRVYAMAAAYLANGNTYVSDDQAKAWDAVAARYVAPTRAAAQAQDAVVLEQRRRQNSNWLGNTSGWLRK